MTVTLRTTVRVVATLTLCARCYRTYYPPLAAPAGVALDRPDSARRSVAEAEPGARPLRAVRAERLLSLRELARLADVAPSTIYLIETGRSTPRLSVIRRLSSALGVDPWAIAEFRRAIRDRAHAR
jgi:DNA-binding XRE family transcriptional regulator